MLSIARINVQERDVFDDCFRHYYQALCYFACRYLKEMQEAEDVVQEVFVKLLAGSERFDNGEHLKHYLYKSVRNGCLNQIKLTGIHSGILETIQKDTPQDENDFFSKVVRAEVYREIMDAVDGLPVECGRVFKLAYVEGLDNEEIAVRLSISINTVKSQKSKAKIQLREKLKGLYPMIILFFQV